MALDAKYGMVTVEVDSVRHPLNGTDEPVLLFRCQDVDLLTVARTYRACHVRRMSELARGAGAVGESEEAGEARSAALASAGGVVQAIDGLIVAFTGWQAEHGDLVKAAD